MTEPVRAVAVVVPAHNEQELLGECLRSIELAADAAPVPVCVMVVLDACSDATRRVVEAAGRVHVLVTDHRAVGRARAAGVARALALCGDTAGRSTWLASTDADSTVPPDWLRHHLFLAKHGADLVLGLVRIGTASASASVHAEWQRRYAVGIDGRGAHSHVHGANLGIHAQAYRWTGGWPAASGHEDRLLVAAARRHPDTTIVTTLGAPVLVSDRLIGRTPVGVAHDLLRLEQGRWH